MPPGFEGFFGLTFFLLFFLFVVALEEKTRMRDVWIAFGLTLFAGMATAIGSVIAFTAKERTIVSCRWQQDSRLA